MGNLTWKGATCTGRIRATRRARQDIPWRHWKVETIDAPIDPRPPGQRGWDGYTRMSSLSGAASRAG